MSVIGAFFLILLIWFLIKVGRLWLMVYRMQRRSRKAFEQMFGNAAGQQETGRPAGWSAPQARKRRIDPSVAETVRWEEVKVTTSHTATSNDGKTTSTCTEQQIVDCEWEEINE